MLDLEHAHLPIASLDRLPEPFERAIGLAQDQCVIDRRSIVANLNIDIIHAIVRLKQVAVIGLDESDLHPNAFPGNSDHASFVFAGIPAVKLMVGFPGEMGVLLENFRKSSYHTPSDDPQQPVNLETIAKFEEVARALLLDVANNPRRPEWKSSGLYKRYAK